jgi:hypothetical protein
MRATHNASQFVASGLCSERAPAVPLTAFWHRALVKLRAFRPLQAVKPISRSQSNGGFRTHSRPPRGDFCRRASRPTAMSKAAICCVRSTSKPVIFDAEPIMRFSLLGRQCLISYFTRGRLTPGRLNSPYKHSRTEAQRLPQLKSGAAPRTRVKCSYSP